MKVGDLIKLVKLRQGGMVGIIVSYSRRLHGADRFDVLTADGQMVKDLPWPYMEVISEAR